MRFTCPWTTSFKRASHCELLSKFSWRMARTIMSFTASSSASIGRGSGPAWSTKVSFCHLQHPKSEIVTLSIELVISLSVKDPRYEAFSVSNICSTLHWSRHWCGVQYQKLLLTTNRPGEFEFHSADEMMENACTQKNALHVLGRRQRCILPLRSGLQIGCFGDTQYERATQLFSWSPGRPWCPPGALVYSYTLCALPFSLPLVSLPPVSQFNLQEGQSLISGTGQE